MHRSLEILSIKQNEPDMSISIGSCLHISIIVNDERIYV